MTDRVITWSPDTAHIGRCHIAMGVFDGVHLGHQALINGCIEGSRAVHLRCGVVTFDRDPDLVLTPDSAAPQLLPLGAKLHEILGLGVDFVLVIPFDAAMAALPPERFMDDVLLNAASPSLIHVGHDFRFGRYA
ncbi:MAG: riboflavin biosynthesis protein RibF, partial [Actinomycetota bacterium]|nr:riboflavin biosynthesis protein RibF [Actinomycetota bacterium]